jgi:serine/threonine protein kinase
MICPQCQSQNPDNARFCENCGTRLEKPVEAPKAEDQPRAAPHGVDLAPGDVFADRYAIESEVGRGWMGVIYAAIDKRTDHKLALKLVRPERLVVKDALKRVVREVVLSRDIRHPNVVAVYDAGEVAGIPYVATELLQGTSLHAYNRQNLLNGGAWPVETAVEIVRQLLAGLKAAHDAGVVHRDLKPTNILLLDDPAKKITLKITDFALAAASGSTETGATSMGATAYMSPEQIAAPDVVNPSADMYSLSAIFYELLTGVASTGSWQPPSQGRDDVPPALDTLIERGLSNNPRGRPQTAVEYLEKLEEALAKPGAPKPQPISGVLPPAPPPTPKPLLEIAGVKLTPIMVGGIVAAIAAVALVGVIVSNGAKGNGVSRLRTSRPNLIQRRFRPLRRRRLLRRPLNRADTNYSRVTGPTTTATISTSLSRATDRCLGERDRGRLPVTIWLDNSAATASISRLATSMGRCPAPTVNAPTNAMCSISRSTLTASPSA